MKTFKQFIVTAFSTKTVGIFIFFATAILMTLILSSRYYMHHSIIENGVSRKDVFATKDIVVEDSVKTEKLRAEIVKKVPPIYVPIQDDFIRINFEKNLKKIDEVKNTKITPDEKTEELVSYYNIEPDDMYSTRNIEHLVNMSETHFTKIKTAATSSLDKILNEGITENDMQDNLDYILRRNTSKQFNVADLNSIYFLVRSVITPNRVVDDNATELSRKTAADSIKPVMVTFKNGSKIVSSGQVVSKVQKEALRLSGYNVIQLNLSGIVGIFILVLLSLAACAYYIEVYEPQFKRKAYYAIISFLMLLLSVFAATVPKYYLVFFIPIAAFTMLISIFLNRRIALISTLAFLCALIFAFQLRGPFISIYVIGTFATVFTLDSMDYTKRPELTKVGIITSMFYAATTTALYFMEYNLSEITFKTFWMYLISIFSNGIISSFVAFGLMPILESMFKISTPYGLVELANSNNPLLQKLQEKAPGTYNHSQNVAILAEAAAEAIGANVILTKIGALYHDVGKINRPLFFFENQSFFDIENPHNTFSPKFSKMVITTHPRDGVEIAKEYKISPAIYPLILEHHGDSIASYFYNEAVKTDGKENVSEDEFRYNAPKPSSKESAVIMLADGAESAVRSLKNPTAEEIEAKVSMIFKARLNDGQLSASPMTLRDLKTVEATFNRVLKGMHHQRIKYHEDFEKIQEKVSELEDKKHEN